VGGRPPYECNHYQFGAVAFDLPKGLDRIGSARSNADDRRIDELDRLISQLIFFLDRSKDRRLDREQAIAFSTAGPVLRVSA